MKLRHLNRWTLVAACCLVLGLSTTAFVVVTGADDRRTQGAGNEDKKELLRQVEESPDQPLRTLENEDSPLRLTETKVKEVPAHLFTKLTGRVTDLPAVSTVPEARLVNVSGRTVTGFMLLVRDPNSRSTRGVLKSELALKPGESFQIKRDHFVEPERRTTVGENGKTRQTTVAPGIESEKSWIQFAARPDLFVAVARVEFDDGSSWLIREGGEIR
jgi:hypothetical protein